MEGAGRTGRVGISGRGAVKGSDAVHACCWLSPPSARGEEPPTAVFARVPEPGLAAGAPQGAGPPHIRVLLVGRHQGSQLGRQGSSHTDSVLADSYPDGGPDNRVAAEDRAPYADGVGADLALRE